MSVIPMPRELRVGDGSFSLHADCNVVAGAGVAPTTVEHLVTGVERIAGLQLSIANSGVGILLTTEGADAALGNEGYTLDVAAEGVIIRAPADAGVFYGVQTFLQLLTEPGNQDRGQSAVEHDSWQIPFVQVRDWPRFGWRGIMLDASRHFQSVEYVKHYLDTMAMHKLNTFHWHLVDGHGWRIEIAKYPKLTEVGAWRNQPGYPKPGKRERYGGFYTQDEIREIVQYAAKRHITVVPEIEMPGHSMAAIAAYPDLGCLGNPQEVDYFYEYPNAENRFPENPGTNVYCAGNDKTFTFLENVLTEVMELFPSTFIHIGGDEVEKNHWKECLQCQTRKSTEGLQDEQELQSYFIKRIEGFLNDHERRLIGWDEILEGGLAPNATVMSWRGTKGGIAAAKQGHDVVMTPEKPLYFDHGQSSSPAQPKHWPGVETLEEVYAYDPVPSELTAKQAKHILGAQANMWTVYTHADELIDLQTWPRGCALSEIAWTTVDRKDWSGFLQRLEYHKPRLTRLGVNYFEET